MVSVVESSRTVLSNLSDIFSYMFKCFLHLAPKHLNYYRPVALTSLVMKTLEKMVKNALLSKGGGVLFALY